MPGHEAQARQCRLEHVHRSQPEFPGERLVACRNPHLAADRARKREDLLTATEKLLAPIAARAAAGRLHGAAKIGIEVGKVISKYKTAKHFEVTITDDSLAVTRRQAQIDAEARLEERVKAHVLICMLACYLVWHLRRAWAPLTFTDQDPPVPDAPVLPARRSAAAQAKASSQHDTAGRPYRSFRACSSTWPPCPATRSGLPAPRSPCQCSPSRPVPSARPSASSAPPSR